MMLVIACLGVGSVGLILWADTIQNVRLEWLAKPLASLSFLGFAWVLAPLASPYGQLIYLGLMFSFLGDVALIRKDSPYFLIGLGSFFVAHLCYTWAFWGELGGVPNLIILLCVSTVTAGVFLMLRRYLGSLLVPVFLYMGVITVMVAAAGSSTMMAQTPQTSLALIGALLFYGSDISVALLTFVDSSVIHRYWGIPMYYISQYMLALSIDPSRLFTPL